jgi:peptidoglycan LD-endopeptidase LytH
MCLDACRLIFVCMTLVFWVGCVVEPQPGNTSPPNTSPPNTSSSPTLNLPRNSNDSSNTAHPFPSATVEDPPEPLIDKPSTNSSASPTKTLPGDQPIGPSKLIIPVAGIQPKQLQDTYNSARAEGRVHNAIDIMADRGTPVLAASSGRILKLFTSERGGLTIYQLDPDNKTVYYYAHLDRYADNLAEGHFANQGDVIGYVGDTGNAGAGNYHLHFAIWITTDPKHYWSGENINPYPLLRGTVQ